MAVMTPGEHGTAQGIGHCQHARQIDEDIGCEIGVVAPTQNRLDEDGGGTHDNISCLQSEQGQGFHHPLGAWPLDLLQRDANIGFREVTQPLVLMRRQVIVFRFDFDEAVAVIGPEKQIRQAA